MITLYFLWHWNLPAWLLLWSLLWMGFPNSSVGKESACKAGDPSLIPGLGRSARRRERLPTPVFRPGEFHGLYSPWVTQSWTRLSDFHFSTWNAPSHPHVEPLAFKPCSVWCLSLRIILGSRGGHSCGLCQRETVLQEDSWPFSFPFGCISDRRRHDSFAWRN